MFFVSPVNAEMPVTEYKEPTIEDKIEYYADIHGVNAEVMKDTIFCESSYNPNAVGDSGRSRGLSQIFKPAHPHITDEQAFDPDFAINFMATEMANGNAWKWSCWKSLGRPAVS